MKTWFKEKRNTSNFFTLIEEELKEKLDVKDLFFQTGFKNLYFSSDFFKLFQVWPPYIREDRNLFILGTLAFSMYPMYQYFLIANKKLFAYASTVPVYLDPQTRLLPDDGYSWAIKSSISNRFGKKNTLCALAAVVDPSIQGRGLSTIMIKVLKSIAIANNFKELIVPVRPTLKSKFPEECIEEYVSRTQKDNLPFDPWLRAHFRSGGTIRNICHRSMVVKSSLKQWEQWAQQSFSTDSHPIPGGLVPLSIDHVSKTGIYTEPNVWVSYSNL